MKILVHLRPGEKTFYLDLAKDSFQNEEIVTISDIRNKGDYWFGDYIYSKATENTFSKEEIDEIRIRCRFLRKLDKNMAEELIENLAFGLNNFFKTNKFDVIISGIIDCYIQDILHRISSRYKVIYIGFVGHFFEGYTRLSIRGELVKYPRIVMQGEVDKIIQKISDDKYKPNFKLNKEKTYLDLFYFFGREIIKKHIYFPIKKMMERDPLNYHYNTTIDKIDYKSISRNNVEIYMKRINDIREKIDYNAVYIPLHYSPEATLDYWADNPKYSYQEKEVLEILEKKDKDVIVLLKEHPAMFLLRDIEFYKAIDKMENVYLIHPYESSNELLNLVENVAVFTGSVGVEALLRGKRVLAFSENYYSNLHPNIFKINQLTEGAIRHVLSEYDNAKFVKDLLSGMFLCKFYNDKRMYNSEKGILSRAIIDYVEAHIGITNAKK